MVDLDNIDISLLYYLLAYIQVQILGIYLTNMDSTEISELFMP